MDFYEELGINSDATEEDIRRSHRRLIKLLHPDGQTDEDIKALAEIQLRRINGVVDLLYNPERRREYDQHLKKADASLDPTNLSSFSRAVRKFTWRAFSWMALSLLAAIILTVLGVRFWGEHIRSAPGSRPTEISTNTATQSTPKIDTASVSSTTVAVVPAGEPDQPAKTNSLDGVWDWKTEDGSKGRLDVYGSGSDKNSRLFKWRFTRTGTGDGPGESQTGTATQGKK